MLFLFLFLWLQFLCLFLKLIFMWLVVLRLISWNTCYSHLLLASFDGFCWFLTLIRTRFLSCYFAHCSVWANGVRTISMELIVQARTVLKRLCPHFHAPFRSMLFYCVANRNVGNTKNSKNLMDCTLPLVRTTTTMVSDAFLVWAAPPSVIALPCPTFGPLLNFC